MNISVVGLGKLGAVLAAVMADRGHYVVGVDLNPAFVDAFNQGRAPVSEPGLSELVQRSADRLSATSDVGEAVEKSDLTFVLVPTPSGPDGTFSLKHVLKVVEGIALALRNKPAYHLVVISSTVIPGSTGGQVLPLLERISGQEMRRRFRTLLQPGVHCVGQRDSRHVQSRT